MQSGCAEPVANARTSAARTSTARTSATRNQMPRLLDLFCGAGGAAMGYHRAGFEVVGVDIRPQPHYPFEFIQADVTTWEPWMMRGRSGQLFDVIHASPPCQHASVLMNAVGTRHVDLIPKTRELLKGTGLPYVIENVELARLENPILLCGTMVGIPVRRHRLFEIVPALSVLLPPCHCKNGVISGRLVGHRAGGKVLPGRTKPPHFTPSERRAAIGVPWMTTMEARQAIPPEYTEFIGRQILAALERPA